MSREREEGREREGEEGRKEGRRRHRGTVDKKGKRRRGRGRENVLKGEETGSGGGREDSEHTMP